MSRWLREDRPGSIRVVPLDDIILHSVTAECSCAPRVILQGATCYCSETPVLSVRRMIVHNAMDGRE